MTHLHLPLAAFEDVIPFFIPLLIFMIPIIAILTSHQRKMAELIHRGSGENNNTNALIAGLQREVYELRQMVNQHAVALDDLGMNRSLPNTEAPAIPQRPPGPPTY
jgi:hypothetical protein